jgi:hypothetical protein
MDSGGSVGFRSAVVPGRGCAQKVGVRSSVLTGESPADQFYSWEDSVAVISEARCAEALVPGGTGDARLRSVTARELSTC